MIEAEYRKEITASMEDYAKKFDMNEFVYEYMGKSYICQLTVLGYFVHREIKKFVPMDFDEAKIIIGNLEKQ